MLDNFVRGRRANLAWALANGNGRRSSRATSATGAGARADARHRRRLPPGGDPHHPVRRGAAAGARGAGRRHLQRRRGRRAAGVRKLVAASSASVYGLAERVPDRRAPPSLRQRHALRRGQDLQRGPAAQLPRDVRASTTSRCATSTSTARGWTSTALYTEVLVRWMERIAAGEPPLIFGDGKQTMDFVYVADIARANVLAAEAATSPTSVFNVASGVETSLQELAEALLRVMGSDLAIEYGPERAVNGVTRRLADTSAARERPRLRGRDRPRGGPDPPGRVVAGRARRAGGGVRRSTKARLMRGPVRKALVRRRRGRGRRRGDRLRLADAGAAGRRSSSAPSPLASARRRRSPRPAARRRCSSPCTCRGSAPATR